MDEVAKELLSAMMLRPAILGQVTASQKSVFQSSPINDDDDGIAIATAPARHETLAGMASLAWLA